MKQKISVSVDEATVKKLDEILGNGIFRNKSHIIEYSVNKLSEELKNE